MRTVLVSVVLITPFLLSAPPAAAEAASEPPGEPDVQAELREAKAATASLEKSVRYLEGQIDVLRGELERARATEESLRSKASDAELKVAKIEAERDDLREERSRLLRENATLREAKATLETRLAAAEGPGARAGGDPTSEEKRAATLAEEHDALSGELQSMKSECAAAKEKITTLTWANDVLAKELDAAFVAWEGVRLPKVPASVRAVYVVGEGESLSTIAKLFYGDSSAWQALLETNAERITNPDVIEAGTAVLVPRL